MANQLVTRTYRAPEVIVQEKDYHSGVDVWSAGCILGEMLTKTNEARLSGINYSRFLFKGSSCFPLSPCQGKKGASSSSEAVIDQRDQLKVILGILGDQTEEDVCYLSEMRSVNYIEKHLPNLPKINFKKEFPNTDPAVVTLLHNMLEFNPYFRLRASELIKLSVFDAVRDKKLEKACPSKLRLSIDRAGVFDYLKLGDIKFRMSDLKAILA